MPVGEFPNFDACVLHMKGKGHSEDEARALCGSLEANHPERQSKGGPEMSGLNDLWIEVFRAGDYGERGQWTVKDVERLAVTYDPRLHAAPVVIGHPAADAPAWGWVKKLKAAGESLWAQLEKVAPEFEQLVKDGRFTQRSVALYKNLPSAGGPYLRHLGFLGATPPEVKGLQAIQLSDGGGYVAIDFSTFQKEEPMSNGTKETPATGAQPTLAEKFMEHVRGFFSPEKAAATPAEFSELQTKVTKLESELKGAKDQLAVRGQETNSARVVAFAERLTAKKVAPAVSDPARLIAEALLNGSAEVTFTEGEGDKKTEKKVSLFQAFCDLIEGNAAIVPTTELAHTTTAAAKGKVLKFNETRDLKVDPESEALNARAEAIAAELRQQDSKLTELAAFKEGLSQARTELVSGAQAGGIAAGKV